MHGCPHVNRVAAFLLGLGICIGALVGCTTTVDALPQRYADIALDAQIDRLGPGRTYVAATTVQARPLSSVLAAGRTALGQLGFTIVRDHAEVGVILAERGKGVSYLDVVVGIYGIQDGPNVQVKVASIAAKDPGLIELAENAWPTLVVRQLAKNLASQGGE